MNDDVLLHLPHASTAIPEEWRGPFHLSPQELDAELIRMTDSHTDVLFDVPGASRLVFPVSRLLVDPERFESDEDEPMAARGMGAVYTKTHNGKPLKSAAEREALMETYYRPHHLALSKWTNERLQASGRCVIIDCHSFPSVPLLCDLSQDPERPDVCIGTTNPHTLPDLAEAAVGAFEMMGYSVEVDSPYRGTIVPLEHYRKEPRVASVMIEINRRLYMNESTGERSENFDKVTKDVRRALELIVAHWRSEAQIEGEIECVPRDTIAAEVQSVLEGATAEQACSSIRRLAEKDDPMGFEPMLAEILAVAADDRPPAWHKAATEVLYTYEHLERLEDLMAPYEIEHVRGVYEIGGEEYGATSACYLVPQVASFVIEIIGGDDWRFRGHRFGNVGETEALEHFERVRTVHASAEFDS